jgi:hypothetical protein
MNWEGTDGEEVVAWLTNASTRQLDCCTQARPYSGTIVRFAMIKLLVTGSRKYNWDRVVGMHDM